MKKTLFLGVGLAGLLTATAVQGGLVLNGDFESGLTGWTSTADVTTVAGGLSGNAASLTIDDFSAFAPYMSWLQQAVGTAGTSYTVDFDVKKIGAGGTWVAFLGGASLVQDFSTSGLSTFTHFHYTVTPIDNTGVLFDFYQAGPGGALLIDNVNVSAVPEASSMMAGCLALAAAGLGAFRRFGKQASLRP